MSSSFKSEEPRRRLLLGALASGLVTGVGVMGPFGAMAQNPLRRPRPLPTGRSIYELSGEVRINGRSADTEATIRPTDLVETGENGKVIFAVGKDAFLLRSNSRLQLEREGAVVSALRLITGRLLSVFGRRRHRVHTNIATLGIEGTGIYVEAEPDRTYVCTCYGVTQLTATDDPESTEEIVSLHHDRPRYVLAGGGAGERIRKAPFKNHDDLELMTIEAIVGRSPPFPLLFDRYSRPRRDYN